MAALGGYHLRLSTQCLTNLRLCARTCACSCHVLHLGFAPSSLAISIMHVLLVEVVVCSSAFACHDFFMYVRRRAAWLPGGLNGLPALDACFRPPLLGWQKRSETCFQGVGAVEALRRCMHNRIVAGVDPATRAGADPAARA